MIEIRAVGSADTGRLARFFETLAAHGIDRVFRPHALSEESARERATYLGRDLYFMLIEKNEDLENDVLGYGILRGWDEGYEIPSLGIAIRPDAQRQGLARLLMNFLHVAALRRGAKAVRLRVLPSNGAAVSLYRSLGYDLVPEKGGPYLVGSLQLIGRR
jgi:ribosomal protein S18 acetylase RimI-like enzyme